MAAALKKGVIAKVPAGDDVEVHVRVDKVEGETLVEVRDYVKSTKEYGRGAILPADPDVLKSVGSALVNLSGG